MRLPRVCQRRGVGDALSERARTLPVVTRGSGGRRRVPRDRAALPKVSSADVVAVRCPRCLANVGNPCRTAEGRTLAGGHQQRRLAAQRAAFRSGKRPGPVAPAKPLTAEAAARRDEYRRQQKTPPVGKQMPAAEPSFDERGRRIVPAAEAVSRSGRHRLRVDDGLPGPVRPVRYARVSPPARSRPATAEKVADVPMPARGSSGLAERLPAPDPAWGRPRLPVELIPPSLWGQSGKKILSTGDWDKVRHRVYALAGHRCEVCGGVGARHAVEAAERWVYDDDLLVQTLVGVTALCPMCHAATTPGRAAWLAREKPEFYSELPDQVRCHLAAVNGWSREVTDAYLLWSFQVHALRCEYDGWSSDWSYFARTYGVGDGVLSTEQICSRCFLVAPARLCDEDGVCSSCR